MRFRTAAASLVGPAAFLVAEAIASRREPGYRRRDEPVSALAARGSASAPIMVPGFLGLAAGSIVLARFLRGSAVAPDPVPGMLTLAGLTVAGAGLARCSDRSCPTRFLGDEGVTRVDDVHAAFSGATFALWITIPLVAAARAGGAGTGYRRACCALSAVTLAGLVGGGLLARSPSQRWSGAAQRAMLTTALAWFPIAGFAVQRA
jgi:hypothetical protein